MTTQEVLEKLSSLKVLVIGDIMLDCYVWGDATRISPEAPVPVVEVGERTYTPGGAANAAMNVKSLGADVEICGWIGSDEPGNRLLDMFREAGIAFRDDVFQTEISTVEKTRVFVRHQQLCRLDRETALPAYSCRGGADKDPLLKAVGGSDVIVFSDYAKGFLSSELIAAVTDVAHAAGRLVALDPKPSHSLEFHGLDLVTPNRREALELAGMSGNHAVFPAEKVCSAIWDRHRPGNLVITLGEEGMLLSRDGKVTKTIPAVAREVFDVSGAGDTIMAAFSLALAAGAEIGEAADFANAAAGVVIGKVGTATALPEEILAYPGRQ